MQRCNGWIALVTWCLVAGLVLPPGASAQQSSAGTSTPTFSTEELQQMLAPIALYPDALLAQIFMASTYPLEVVEAARWVKQNPNLQGEQLDTAVASKNWDPTVTALIHFPQVLSMMNENLEWTAKLGDAFLAQKADVMNAVQYLRAKAQAEGNLQSTKEQTVVVEKEIIRVEPADPQVIYVPTYNPTVVYGSWWYPSYPPPPIYYPGYYPGAAFAAGAITFGAGLVTGAALAGSFNWYDRDIDIDIDRNVNINRNIQRTDISRSSRNTQRWQHDAAHRKGVAYRDRGTSQRYGQTRARQPVNSLADRGHARADRSGGGSNRPGGGVERPGGGSNRPGSGVHRPTSAGRPSGGGVERPGGGSNRPGSGVHRPTSAGRPPTASSNRHGSGAFGGMSDGSRARQASQRGQMSRHHSSGGGGFHGGGGGFHGGGGRGGGGRRR